MAAELAAISVSINSEIKNVGGDAHIAPQKKPPYHILFRRIRNILRRADVGIGPYGYLFRQSDGSRIGCHICFQEIAAISRMPLS